jgi:hypothetical protein
MSTVRIVVALLLLIMTGGCIVTVQAFSDDRGVVDEPALVSTRIG